MLGIEPSKSDVAVENPAASSRSCVALRIALSSSTMATSGPSGILVVSVFVENCAIAQRQVDYGTVTAIEIYRASDNQPINAGTVLGRGKCS